jgi:hypothetical protein
MYKYILFFTYFVTYSLKYINDLSFPTILLTDLTISYSLLEYVEYLEYVELSRSWQKCGTLTIEYCFILR